MSGGTMGDMEKHLDDALESEIPQITDRKSMIKLYIRVVNSLSKLDLKNINLNVDIKYRGRGVDFSITFFNDNHKNGCIYFYDMHTEEKNLSLAKESLAIIKRDDFDKLVSFVDTGRDEIVSI